MAILDLCCGYGKPTLDLRDKLISNGVEISKLIGYDVSADMIRTAQSKNEHFPQVQFHRKNAESEFDDVDEYDVVFCLFGLHWMNDL